MRAAVRQDGLECNTDYSGIWLPARQAANLIGVSKVVFHKNRKAGLYVVEARRGNGGEQYYVRLDSLPLHAQAGYYSSLPHPQAVSHKETLKAVSSGEPSFVQGRAERMLLVPVSPDSMVPENLKTIALARLDLVTAWRDHRRLYGGSHGMRLKADGTFEKAYNMGLLLPQVFEVLGKVDLSTVYRWHRTLAGTADWTLLVPDWNCLERKEPSLTPIEKETFSKCLLNPSRMSIGEATKMVKAALIKRDIPSPSAPITFRRWANWFRTRNSHIWTLMREGEKALKDKEIFSMRRDTSKLNVGDVLIADGHRLNFQVINPFTGKPCRATLIGYLDWKSWNLAGFEIMIEENTQAIASALRNSIINLGKIPRISYQDNGKAFRARFFTQGVSFEESGLSGLFGRLGISPVYARPYNARAKVIERWFKEFTGKFERLLPSFTGASVVDKPAWLMRNEKFHRIHHNDYIPTIQEAVEFINAWIHEYLEIQPCPHVKGKTIGEVFNEGRGPGVDVTELDELMLATEVKTIRANGIRFLGADYYDDALFGLREQVFVKYSLSDLSHVRVYDRQGRFLCKADRTVSTHPMAALLGDAKDVAEVKHLISKQRSLQKAVVKAAKELMPGRHESMPWSDIVPLSPRTIKKLEEVTAPAPETGERHIPEYMLKSTQAKDPEPLPVVPENSQDPKPVERPMFDSQTERYEWHLKYGCQTKEDEEWVERFKTTPIYEKDFGWFEKQAQGLVKDMTRSRYGIRR
ncbi:MAG: transposase [Syntrophorhabdaceae bacterium]|nr:transposase [Syntrophorhabdaceae bacterium]